MGSAAVKAFGNRCIVAVDVLAAGDFEMPDGVYPPAIRRRHKKQLVWQVLRIQDNFDAAVFLIAELFVGFWCIAEFNAMRDNK